MEVVVVGAGPGGLAAAVALRWLGHEVAVFERAPSLRLGGSAVTLWPNGSAVLDELGVPLGDLGPEIDILDGRDHRDRPLLQMRTAAVVTRFGAPTMSVQRGRLVQRLAWALPPDVLHFDATCTDVDPVAELYRRRAEGLTEGDPLTGWRTMSRLLVIAPHRATEFHDAVAALLSGDDAATRKLIEQSSLAQLAADVR